MKNYVACAVVAAWIGLGWISSSGARAQWVDEDGQPLAEESWRKSAGDFRGMLLISPDPGGFLNEWAKPPSRENPPNLVTTSTAPRGDATGAFVLFQGCRPNPDGNCDASVDFEVLSPDGSVYASLDDAELWRDKPEVAVPVIQLGVDYMVTLIDPEDPLGRYTVRARLCDQVAERCIDLTSEMEATHRLSEFDFEEMVSSYYLDPRPDFVPQFIESADHPNYSAAFVPSGPIEGFLAEIFARNPDKVEVWMALVEGLDQDRQQVFLEAKKHAQNPKAVVGSVPPSPSHNDWMWGAYFASGDTEYLDGIIATLPHSAHRESQEVFLAGATARWSLASNAQQHFAIERYVRERLQGADDELAPLLREALERDPASFREDLVRVIREQKEAGVW